LVVFVAKENGCRVEWGKRRENIERLDDVSVSDMKAVESVDLTPRLEEEATWVVDRDLDST
jgi:hypothetical protein